MGLLLPIKYGNNYAHCHQIDSFTPDIWVNARYEGETEYRLLQIKAPLSSFFIGVTNKIKGVWGATHTVTALEIDLNLSIKLFLTLKREAA